MRSPEHNHSSAAWKRSVLARPQETLSRGPPGPSLARGFVGKRTCVKKEVSSAPSSCEEPALIQVRRTLNSMALTTWRSRSRSSAPMFMNSRPNCFPRVHRTVATSTSIGESCPGMWIRSSRFAPGWTSVLLSTLHPRSERSIPFPSPPTTWADEKELRNWTGKRGYLRNSIRTSPLRQ